MSFDFSDLSLNIGRFLAQWVSVKSCFGKRSFYGESFTLALLHRENILEDEVRLALIHEYKKLDRRDSQFHWEFNNYALLDYYSRTGDEEVRDLLFPLTFKNTP